MNSPRSLISTSSSGGIGIGVAVSELVQRTRRSADPICVCCCAYNNVACRMWHDRLDNCAATVAATEGYNSIADPNAWPPPPPAQRNCSQVTHCSPCFPAPSSPSLCLALALMLMHVRVPDIIVVRGSVCRSLSARASASASTRCGQWGTP